MLNMLKLLALSSLLILNLNSFGASAKATADTIQFTRSESGNHYWDAGKPTTRTGYFLGLAFSKQTVTTSGLSFAEMRTLTQTERLRDLHATRSNDVEMGNVSAKLNKQQRAEELALIEEANLTIKTSTNPHKIAHAHAILATFKPKKSGCVIS